MKKLLSICLITIFFFFPLSFSFAQTGEEDVTDDVEIQILEEEADTQEEEQEAEEESLAESLDTEEDEEQIQPPGRDYWTILGAILIPSAFIVVCYFILKAFET